MKYSSFTVLFFLLTFFSFNRIFAQGIIVNHNCINLSQIPDELINSAKANLHIAYGHTSHGSQLIDGMSGLQSWKGDKYSFSNGGGVDELDLHDYAFNSYGGYDLGNPNRTKWAQATRDYLDLAENGDINVIIWSWCGEVSTADSNDIATYLNLMSQLENDYPKVKFVYMTGHLDGTGVDGNLNQRNEQIRQYCINNNKILFDFADIESHDPNGNYYLDKLANDACDYDSDGDLSRDKNWATDWQNSHTEGVDWYSCSAAHSKPLNANMKAYAAWWLWASIANSNSIANAESFQSKLSAFFLEQNYPNPFNPTTTIKFSIPNDQFVSLTIHNILGEKVATLVNNKMSAGNYGVNFNAANLASGVYIYKLSVGYDGSNSGNNFISTKKMILMK